MPHLREHLQDEHHGMRKKLHEVFCIAARLALHEPPHQIPDWLFKLSLGDMLDPAVHGRPTYLGALNRLANYITTQFVLIRSSEFMVALEESAAQSIRLADIKSLQWLSAKCVLDNSILLPEELNEIIDKAHRWKRPATPLRDFMQDEVLDDSNSPSAGTEEPPNKRRKIGSPEK